LGGQRTNVARAAAVDTDLLAQDAGAYFLLGDRAERPADLLLAALELARELLGDLVLDAVQGILAVSLADGLEVLGGAGPGRAVDGGQHVLLILQEDRELGDRLGRDVGEFLLRTAQLPNGRLRSLETARDDLLGRRRRTARDQVDGVLGGLSLDHH